MFTLVQRTAQYVKSRLEGEKTGHDWAHVYRVWQLAKFLQQHEGGDLELVELAALLHSVSEQDNKKTTQDDKIRSMAMWGILDVLDLDEDLKNKIIGIGEECRFRGAETVVPKTIEGKIVQDANWLDGIGAVGIGRFFTAGGYMGREIYNPDYRPVYNLPNQAFQKRKKDGTTINYFYEKILQSYQRLNTPTARLVGASRVQYLKDFLVRFNKEWSGEDYAEISLPAVPQSESKVTP